MLKKNMNKNIEALIPVLWELAKISRITIDLDDKNIKSLIKALKILKRYGFTKDLTVKPSATDKGFHIIAWHKKNGYPKKKLLKIRGKAGDDKMRIYLDSKSNRQIQVLFTTKKKEKSDLQMDGIPMEKVVKGSEVNCKISFGEI